MWPRAQPLHRHVLGIGLRPRGRGEAIRKRTGCKGSPKQSPRRARRSTGHHLAGPAMVQTLRRLILGNTLSEASRGWLTTWMIGGRDAATGGLPPGCRIANKPRTWKGVATKDIGVIWPPDRGPIIVAAYHAESPASIEAQEAVLADVSRIVAEGFGQSYTPRANLHER